MKACNFKLFSYFRVGNNCSGELVDELVWTWFISDELIRLIKELSTNDCQFPVSCFYEGHSMLLSCQTWHYIYIRPDTSQRKRIDCLHAPGHCLGALEMFCRNLQFPHRVPFTKEKMPWCPCPFKNKAQALCFVITGPNFMALLTAEFCTYNHDSPLTCKHRISALAL